MFYRSCLRMLENLMSPLNKPCKMRMEMTVKTREQAMIHMAGCHLTYTKISLNLKEVAPILPLLTLDTIAALLVTGEQDVFALFWPTTMRHYYITIHPVV
ncbi:unnamed protein product [Strongylus vulgaris]|uniref:Uncharacterized protein n=1 Tax=Strongylus vulgaris TaxID=40348 RepID=A0A3P7KIG6_STRVU|nr:unnamed protein product [Strongylus vulgaris]